MRKNIFFPILILIIMIACNYPTNYKDAYIVKNGDTILLKVKGKRVYMSHDLSSIFTNDMYEDSFLIPIVKYCSDCIILGKNIPTEEGHYKLIGQIKIENNIADVQLLVNNTDDKVIQPFEWNGRYTLKNSPK